MTQEAKTEPFKKFIPHVGVVVFKTNYNDYYLQVHDINKVGKVFQWGEGKPFQREQLQELALFLRNENLSTLKLKGLLPENVLYYQPSISGNKFVWYLKPEVRHMTFNAQLKLKAGTYSLPGLVMAVNDRDLYVYAVKGNEKPNGKTELFNAPFYNIYEDGLVCLGTASEARKKNYLHEEIDRWERRFFGSTFTDAHGEDSRLAKDYTMTMLYKSIANRNPFPEKFLAKSDEKNIDGLLKKLEETERSDNDD